MAILTDRLKQLRSEKNLTQKEMAKLLDLGERTYRRYELGEVEPTLSNTIKLANFFDVSIDYLVGRTDSPTSHK